MTRNTNGTFARKFYVPWDSSNWDEGYLHRKGYFMVYRPDHPAATKMGMVRRHHVVWWLRTGEVIQPGEALHHKNGVKTDDRIDNLEKMSHGDHTRLHSALPLIDCTCRVCGKHFGQPKWRIDGGRGKVCSQECWQRHKNGTNHPRAALTQDQLTFIRTSKESASALARQWGVSVSTVCNARNGKTYA